MAIKPIKRAETLLPLSREHHFDLLLAWKIRKGIQQEVDPARMAAYICYLDEELMDAHFRDEETLLFDRMPPEDTPCRRARQEHEEIRRLVGEIAKGERDTEVFSRLADAVEAHVRYEERELFPYLEQQLPADLHAEIAAALAAKHEGFTEVWDDPFWGKSGAK